MKTWLTRTATAVALTVACAAVAGADDWNDKTTLKFTEPMMVPGTTLAPGTYTFKLLDSDTNRHVIQIFNEDETNLITTAMAIPTKRLEPKGDVVLKLNPTEPGSPIAIKSWFYPGSLYGHEFIYSDEQAKEIARRTKTLVLSTDVPNSDMQKGKLYTYNAEGSRGAYQEDQQMMRDWAKWDQEGRAAAGRPAASAKVAAPGGPDRNESTAPMMRATPAGTQVAIGDLEENPAKYAGQTIHTTGEVDEVFGPRIFKLDEPNWGDLDGEVLVYLPSNLAALVREGDRVTVSGTMKNVMKAELERELGLIEPEPDIEIEFDRRPVLLATQIVGGNSDVAMVIDVTTPRSGTANAVGTSGSSGTSGAAGGNAPRYNPITDAAALAGAGSDMVGRHVDVQNVKISRVGKNQGFWVQAGDRSVYVLPSGQQQTKATAGQSVSIQGMVLELPRSLANKAGGGNDDIYVYATTVK